MTKCLRWFVCNYNLDIYMPAVRSQNLHTIRLDFFYNMGSNGRSSFLEPDIYVPDVKQVGIGGPHYNPAVLIGEWFEERCSSETDPRAGTPGIYGKSGCAKDVSIYKSAFTHPLKDNSREAINNFVDWKLKGLSNRLATEATNIRFSDDVGFDKNATRTVDIRYHILPEQEALHTARQK
uniref:Uncharacterized protein n=1 Tax=Glossina pallidipes TaxID=7398 RepID=A0A1B0AF48_GLOPL